jgi:hypothetical protein
MYQKTLKTTFKEIQNRVSISGGNGRKSGKKFFWGRKIYVLFFHPNP